MLHRNLPLKAASVLFAIFLWFWVLLNVEDPILEFPLKVSAVAEGVSEGLTLGRPLRKVDVRVRGLSKEMDETNNGLQAYVSCRNLAPGEYQLPVQVRSPQNMTVVSVRPAQNTLVLEEVVEKSLPTEVDLTGEPALGYEFKDYRVRPTAIKITGARSQVERAAQARVTMDMTGVMPDVWMSVPARALDSSGSPVEDVTLTPPRVSVSLRMNLAVVPRPVPVVVKTIGGAPSGLRVASIRVEPAVVTILGGANRVEEITHVETADLRLSNAQGSFSRSLPIMVPDGVNLLTDPEVTVYVAIEVVAPEAEPPADEEPASEAEG
jgi:YbbR domain-containing protein